MTLDTMNQSKNGAINPQNSKPEKIGNGPVKRMGRPPKKGTHTATSSLANVINIESEDEEQAASASKRSRKEEVENVEENVEEEVRVVDQKTAIGALWEKAMVDKDVAREKAKALEVAKEEASKANSQASKSMADFLTATRG